MNVRIVSFAIVASLLASAAAAQDVHAARHMRRDAGSWDVTLTMFGDPSGKPIVSKGTETRFMLGDKWLISHFKGDVMGAQFEGVRQTGFDPKKKKFVGSWIDSLSPYQTQSEGTWDEKSRTMTSTGTGKGPLGNEIKTKMVTTYDDDGSHTLTMFMIMNDTEVKLMEFRYTRAREAGPGNKDGRGTKQVR